MIQAASGRRREGPSHIKTVVVGLFALLALAYGVTSVSLPSLQAHVERGRADAWGLGPLLLLQLLSLGSRFGGAPSISIILMVSDGMGEPRFSAASEERAHRFARAGPASETMAREFLQAMHDTKGSNGGTLLNESVWASLAGDFERDGFGRTPLDEILIGASRVGRYSSGGQDGNS
jgi:hypothetical protein